ncbi:phage head closure protein [Undibacter mobilis]|uniref:Head-tail adaptor protein n=1 Tax=Undibacter mobilis TaxID=2292256 RepID=A0A371B3H5_9BRAD|nr:phage head closure protein [Undibacter mobilis]RDV02146.1 head-tail adaptor protein [Undibacter mobilis]
MSAAFDIGTFDRRLVLQAPSETDDGAGGVTRDYAAVATVWGSVTPVAAHAHGEAERQGASVRCRVIIRFRNDVTTRHRLIEGTHIYRIVALREAGRRRFLEIDAEERLD